MEYMFANSTGSQYIDNALSRLSMKRCRKGGRYFRSLHHFNKNTGKIRQKRTDGMSSIFKVLQVMISEIELSTFYWGNYFTNHKGETDLWTYGVGYLCEKTSLHKRTVSRVLACLESCGYLEVERRAAIGKDGEEMRIFSLRRFTEKFFRELGFQNTTIEVTKNRKRKKLDKKHAGQKMTSICKDSLSRLGMIMKTAASEAKAKLYPKPKRAPKVDDHLSAQTKAILRNRAYEISISTGRQPVDVYLEELSKL